MASYQRENLYTFLTPSRPSVLGQSYQTATPVTEFEQSVQSGLVAAGNYLRNGEYGLALSAYKEMAALILHTIDPTLPTTAAQTMQFSPIWTADIIEPIMQLAMRTLQATPPPQSTVPSPILATMPLPPSVLGKLARYTSAGVQGPTYIAPIGILLGTAQAAIAAGDVAAAKTQLQQAITFLPQDETTMRAAIQRDLTTVQAVGSNGAAVHAVTAPAMSVAGAQSQDTKAIIAAVTSPATVALASRPILQAQAATGTRLNIVGDASTFTIDLSQSTTAQLRNFYELRSTTDDMGLIVPPLQPTVNMAYLLHTYFYVLPMAIGDCYMGLGDYASAAASYRGALSYPYINLNVELVRLWMRMAENYIDWGDQLYRRAVDNTAQYPAARQMYELVITSSGKVNATSPLYREGLTDRIGAVALGKQVHVIASTADNVPWHQVWDEDWESLGGLIISVPSMLLTALGSLHVFGVGADSMLHYRKSVGGVWQGNWLELGGPLINSTAAVQVGVDLSVFAVAMGDLKLCVNTSHDGDGKGWSGWKQLTGACNGSPLAISIDNLAHVFVLSFDNALYHGTWTANTWSDWQCLGGTIIGRPTVVSWGSNRIDVFVVSTDGALYHKWWDGTSWGPSLTGWENLGGAFVGSPSAVSRGANRLDIFAIGLDGALNYKYWNGAAWGPSLTGWERLGGSLAGGLQALVRAANALQVVAIGTDAQLYRKTWNGSQWVPANDLEPIRSPSGKFAALRQRVETIAQSPSPTTLDENPATIRLVLRALQKLRQLDGKLNFFGFAPDYLPPFSFEYLQSSARYLAQQALRIEQEYITFQSHAEDQQLAADQAAQQVATANASVSLEQANVDEANDAVAISQASNNYAATQYSNAVDAKNQFDANKAQIRELDGLTAWANAAAVDQGSEVQLTISRYTYYNTSSQRRSIVIQQLTNQRSQITNQLEDDRLNNDITSAQAYQAVTKAQLTDAQARAGIAQLRLQVAQLQSKFAADNLAFIDGKEFNARMWYEMARAADGLARRYLDMATEVAFLMERAYLLETGRDLNRIRFDYGGNDAAGMLGGDFLGADIDSFTEDYMHAVQARKVPIKTAFSLSDDFPTAFRTLLASGSCSFETTLAHFERCYPGAWLAKIKNVEIAFVGLTSAGNIAGMLRNIGASRVRNRDGSEQTVATSADVLPLSQFMPREDSLLFQFDPNQLRAFENCGVATAWQLILPLDANDFNFAQIVDVQLAIYWDAFFDAALEQTVRKRLPVTGAAARATSLGVSWPDELFYLRNRGSADIAFDDEMVPHFQTAPVRTKLKLRFLGAAATVGGLKVKLTSDVLATTLSFTTAADGTIDASGGGSPLAPLLGKSLFDHWALTIDAADNPALFPGGKPNLAGITDLQFYSEYTFTYRTSA